MLDSRVIVHCTRLGKSSKYGLYFNYNIELIEKIKALPSEDRKYEAQAKIWILPVKHLFSIIKSYKGATHINFDFGNPDSRNVFIELVKKIDAQEKEKQKLIEELNIKKEKWILFKNDLEKNYKDYSQIVHKNLKPEIKLYPHQIVAIMFANETRNVLISHEMGLGKSLDSIAYVEMNEFEKVLVITPNSLKFNYYDEINKFTNSKAHIVNWKKNIYNIEESKYVIINYDFFNPSDKDKVDKKWENLKIGQINCLILDECQKIKESKTNIYKNYKRIFKPDIFIDDKISKIFLSGTPLPNKSAELYNVLHEISPLDFATKKYFLEYYCGMTYNPYSGYGWEVNEAETKFEELYYKIAPYTHRKRKIDALPDLPEKTYQKILLEMSDKEYLTYNDIEDGIVNEFLEKPTNNPLTLMIRLRQYTSSLKISSVLEIVEQILNEGEKVVIVDYFKDSLYKLKEIYGDIACLHTGDQDVEERAEMIKEFQNSEGKYKIFLGSIQTCNYGLTLTAASKMIVITMPYSSGEFLQLSDRLHRLNQRFPVNIYTLVYKDTIDEIVFEMVESKRKEIVKVLDNENYKSDINTSVISEVMAKIKKKHGK